MTETDVISSDAAPDTSSDAAPERRRRGGVSGMVLADLRDLAATLGVTDTAGMRRGDLITEIRRRQGETRGGAAQLPLGDDAAETPTADHADAETSAAGMSAETSERPPRRRASRGAASPAPASTTGEDSAARTAGPASSAADVTATSDAIPAAAAAVDAVATPRADAPAADAVAVAAAAPAPAADAPTGDADTPAGDGAAPEPATSEPAAPADGQGRSRSRRSARRDAGSPTDGTAAAASDGTSVDASAAAPPSTSTDTADGRDGRGRRERPARGEQQGEAGRDATGDTDRDDRRQQQQGQQQQGQQQASPDDDEDDGGGRRRGRRFRDRRRNRNERGQGGGQGGGEPEVREDDVLIPVAGILDVLDNYAFVRTSGYMAGPNDVYVSLSLVRKFGLRRGDAVTGQIKQQRESEQSRQKFNPLVRVDSVNGLDPEQARRRPEFTKLTPLYPNERLRMETESHQMTTRVIDLVMPVGKGQRALIVSPPKAGKTMVLQAIANAITTNNPEVHLMVVLVDERPEEVTDMQRSVKGEVIASTFDRPPSDHTSVAELSIERAKRLVEQGHDVVVLLDSITRLGRAYNLAAPASGRILSGGVDSTALYPPKRFLGAARNIEDGGSLTIFATALVETGSTMDTVIFEEFKGTGNAELKLDRRLADKRIFPAIDPDPSGTRKEELLLSPDEMAVMHRLRRVLAALDSQQAIELVLDRLRKTRTNIEFLMQVAKTTPGGDE